MPVPADFRSVPALANVPVPSLVPCQIVLDREARIGLVDECAAVRLVDGALPAQVAVPTLVRVRPLSASSSLSPAWPSCRPPWAMVVPAPSIVPPVQTVMPLTVKVPGPVRSPLDSFRVPVEALPSNSIVPPSMVVVPAKPYASAPEVTRKSPLWTSTMPGPPMPAPASSVKSPSNWSVRRRRP